MSEADLSKINLRFSSLAGSNLSETNLSNAFFYKVDLNNTYLFKAILSNSKIIDGNFTNANCTWSNMTSAELRYSDFTLSDLSYAKLYKADLYSADLSKSTCEHANFTKSYLQNSIMKESKLMYADMTEAYMKGANLSNSDCTKAKLVNAYLYNATLINTYLHYADLKDTNFALANMTGSNLYGATSYNSLYYDTILDHANLTITKLKAAKLYGSSLYKTIYAPLGCPDAEQLGVMNMLSTIVCDTKILSGTIELRNALRKSGFKELEREVTYAIERARAEASPFLEKWFKTVLFDWPSAYGMYPGRPLWLLLGMFLAFIPIYWAALWRRKEKKQDGTLSKNKMKQVPEQPQAALFMALVLAAAATLAGALLFNAAYRLAQRPDWPHPGATAIVVFCILILAYWLVLWRAGIQGDCRQRRGRPRTKPKLFPSPQRFEALVVSIIPGLIAAGLFIVPVYLGVNRDFPVLCLTLVVTFCIAVPTFWLARLRAKGGDGVYRVWSEKRVRKDLGEKRPLRLRRPFWRAMLWAAYFSLLSTFNLGFREINVGNWIARIQPREYALQATGWVRAVAGTQSLLSFYLLALWVLTYFGRPFE